MRRAVFVVVFLIVLTTIAGGFWASDRWARQLIYPLDSSVTKFPGDGHATVAVKEQLWIIPKEDRGSFFAPLEDETNYSRELYDIVYVPEQTQLAFAVGKVEGWEDIENSEDKYLILSHSDSDTVQTYRIAFSQNDLFGVNPTELVIEKVGWPYFASQRSRFVMPKVSLISDIGFYKAKQMIKKGDTVVVMPVWDPPDLSKKDITESYLAAKLFIRRLGR